MGITGVWGQHGSRGSSEKGSVSEYISNRQTLGCADGLDVMDERRKVRSAADFDLSLGKDRELLLIEKGKTEGRAGLGGDIGHSAAHMSTLGCLLNV